MGQKPYIYVCKQAKLVVIHSFRSIDVMILINLQHSCDQMMQSMTLTCHVCICHIYVYAFSYSQSITLYFLLYVLCLLVSHMLTDMAYIARIYTRIPCTALLLPA